jgi:hypothetical protein
LHSANIHSSTRRIRSLCESSASAGGCPFQRAKIAFFTQLAFSVFLPPLSTICRSPQRHDIRLRINDPFHQGRKGLECCPLLLKIRMTVISAGSCNSISRECRMRPCPAKQIHCEFQSSIIFRVRGHIGFRAFLLYAVSLKMVT